MSPNLPSRAQVVIVGGGIVGCERGLPPDQARLERRGAAGAQAAHLRHHLARRRPGRPAARHPQPDRAGPATRRNSSPGSSRRPGRRPASSRTARSPSPATEGALRGTRARRLHGAELRPRGAGDHAGGGARTVPADRHRRHGRRHLSARRRADQPGRHHPGAGQGGAQRRRQGVRGRRRHRREPPRTAASPACRTDRRATSRPSTWSTAPACGRARWAAWSASPCPLHAAEHFYVVTEPMAGLPGTLPVMRDPIALHLRQGGRRQAADRLLRAERQALGHGRHPGGLLPSTSCPRTGTTSSR